jgi:hypothetical protein
VAALRERADGGASAVEVARWLRGRLGPGETFMRFIGLLHHAFDVPLDTLRPLKQWSGWDPAGQLGDAEVERLMSPLRSRPADFDRATLWRRPPLRLPPAQTRPFVPLSYVTSHSRLVLRSQVGDDLLDVLMTGVEAMRVRDRYDRLEITEATGAARREAEAIADVAEPFDTARHHLRLSDGERAGFVVCGNVSVLRNGVPYALSPGAVVSYEPVGAVDPAATPPLRFATGFGVWSWTSRRHDLVLRARTGGTDLVFSAVRELQVRHFFDDDLAVAESPGGDGLRRYTLTDGRHEGYVLAAGVRVHRH